MKNFLFAFCILIALGSCKKEPLHHPIYGEWETVNAVGFKWQYDIREGGLFCRSLPEVYGLTKLCYEYKRQDDTVWIFANDPERWTLDIQTRDAILVTVKRDSSGQTDAFLISRKK